MSYDMIDRFLRNNLYDDDYKEYSEALDELCIPKRPWVGLTDDEVYKIVFNLEGEHWKNIAQAIEAKLKEKNT
jgi:hypothetical protein